jgi:hypothetical protein
VQLAVTVSVTVLVLVMVLVIVLTEAGGVQLHVAVVELPLHGSQKVDVNDVEVGHGYVVVLVAIFVIVSSVGP